METEIVEIIRFVEPVDFSTELEHAVIKAVVVATIGVAIGVGGMLLENRLKARATRKLVAELEAKKSSTQD